MVYYVSYSWVPDGDAPSVRSVNIARIFMGCGLDVRLLGMGDSEYLQVIKNDNLCYLSLRIKGRDILTRLRSYFGFKSRLKKFLDQADHIDAIILNMNTLPINALWYIKKKSKREGIKLFVDCCEWYSPEQFKMGRMSFLYMLNIYCVQKYIDSYIHPIAISKYLASYFNQKGYRTADIPAILDVENAGHVKTSKSDRLILMYAGSIGKKDYLHVMLTGLSLLSRDQLANIEFRIFGANLSQLKDNIEAEVLDKVNSSIKCYGRVDRQVVLKNLEDADFTVLMRSSTQRYAKAGFPTKVVESLASATPVICNLTSDLGDYIVDGYNGVVVDGDSARSFGQAVKKAVGISVSEKETMSNNARITAEKHFDYRLYENQIMNCMGDMR